MEVYGEGYLKTLDVYSEVSRLNISRKKIGTFPGFVQVLSHCDCVSEIGCKSHEECALQKACINGRCADPCTFSSPCLGEQECQVIDHQPVCIKGKQKQKICFDVFYSELKKFLVCKCQKQSDCRGNSVCDGCDCIERE